VGRQLLAAYRRSVAACARVGFDVIVDEVAFDQVAVADWNDALAGLRTTWIAVHCRADVAAERERMRGDRYEGLALGLSGVVHEQARYDLELDTTDSPVESLLAALTRLVCS
jgi:chloramphenicol 3-O phosphotransferase